jgi:hypothetical protein
MRTTTEFAQIDSQVRRFDARDHSRATHAGNINREESH